MLGVVVYWLNALKRYGLRRHFAFIQTELFTTTSRKIFFGRKIKINRVGLSLIWFRRLAGLLKFRLFSLNNSIVSCIPFLLHSMVCSLYVFKHSYLSTSTLTAHYFYIYSGSSLCTTVYLKN